MSFLYLVTSLLSGLNRFCFASHEGSGGPVLGRIFLRDWGKHDLPHAEGLAKCVYDVPIAIHEYERDDVDENLHPFGSRFR